MRRSLASSFRLLPFGLQSSRFFVLLNLGPDAFLCFDIIEPFLLLLLRFLQSLFLLKFLLRVLGLLVALPANFLKRVLKTPNDSDRWNLPYLVPLLVGLLLLSLYGPFRCQFLPHIFQFFFLLLFRQGCNLLRRLGEIDVLRL